MKIDSKNLLKLATIVLISGVILIFVSPYLLTRSWGLLPLNETGQIGDTIGGLTAPVINLMSAILVFLALAAQVEANRLIQKQIEDQKEGDLRQKNFANLLEIYKQVKNDFDNFSYRENLDTKSKFTNLGKEGIELFLQDIIIKQCSLVDNDFHLSQFDSFIELLVILELLSQKIKSSQLLEVDLSTLQALTKYLFDSRIKVFLWTSEQCYRCGKKHDIYPEQFSVMVEKINNNLNPK